VIEAPALVTVERAGVVESMHRGLLVIVDGAGDVVFAAGDPQTPIYPRSSVKPLQAAGMLAAGLALSGSRLALASASHSGEPFHLAAVQEMLGQVGLGVEALRCPPDWPYGVDASRAYIAAGHKAAPVAMNCSGKHAAMLMTCVARDWPLTSYLEADHPLQLSLREYVEAQAGPILMSSVDGCGAPLWGLRLVNLARAFAGLAGAAPEVVAAMRAHPDYVGGTTRDVSQLMRAVPDLVTKDGAEAVQAIGVEVNGERFGIALKIADGTDRARPIVAAAALRFLGVDAPLLDDLEFVPVLGGGRPVGQMGMAAGVFGT
jgi:L-asparaginase II